MTGRWKSSQMPAHYAKAELAERGAIAQFKEKRGVTLSNFMFFMDNRLFSSRSNFTFFIENRISSRCAFQDASLPETEG